MLRTTILGISISLIILSLQGCASSEPLARTAPFAHVVLFKTKSGTPEAAATIVRDVNEMLAHLPTVKGLWVGSPAPTATRPIVDANYDVGLLVLFEDQKGLQEYLDHPTHVEFAKKHDTECQVRVFDFTPKT